MSINLVEEPAVTEDFGSEHEVEEETEMSEKV
jgi:hypothetical protein